MALMLATPARVPSAEATRPGETAWACRCCGAVLAYIRGRAVTLPSGDRFVGVVFFEVRCPDCRRLARKWLVPRRRDKRT